MLSSNVNLEIKKHLMYEDRILGTLHKLLTLNSPNLALYVDFSLLRYPLTKIVVVPIVTNGTNEINDLYELIGVGLVEIVLNVESLYRGKINLNKDIFSMRLLCEHGWIVHEYTVLRSEQGIPYISKLWMHVVEGKQWREAIEVNEEFSRYISDIVDRIALKARETLENDGYL